MPIYKTMLDIQPLILHIAEQVPAVEQSGSQRIGEKQTERAVALQQTYERLA